MKKRYGKFFALLLFSSALGCIAYPYGIISMLSKKWIGYKKWILFYLISFIWSLVLVIILTKRLKKRTPEGERLSTWFRAFWLGFRIAFKLALSCTLVLLLLMMGMRLSVPDVDTYEPHWYDERGKVRDPNGNEYKVGRSGDYIKDSSGNWIRVFRANNGDPYIEKDSEKIWLE